MFNFKLTLLKQIYNLRFSYKNIYDMQNWKFANAFIYHDIRYDVSRKHL